MVREKDEAASLSTSLFLSSPAVLPASLPAQPDVAVEGEGLHILIH